MTPGTILNIGTVETDNLCCLECIAMMVIATGYTGDTVYCPTCGSRHDFLDGMWQKTRGKASGAKREVQ